MHIVYIYVHCDAHGQTIDSIKTLHKETFTCQNICFNIEFENNFKFYIHKY